MIRLKRGQISVEYLIIAGFVMFLVIGILGAGLLYSSQTRDRVQLNQITSFSDTLIQEAEAVFYAGEPSQITMKGYLPESVENITVQTNEIIFTIRTNSGLDTLSFKSDVPLQGSIPATSGVKKILLRATSGVVVIAPA